MRRAVVIHHSAVVWLCCGRRFRPTGIWHGTNDCFFSPRDFSHSTVWPFLPVFVAHPLTRVRFSSSRLPSDLPFLHFKFGLAFFFFFHGWIHFIKGKLCTKGGLGVEGEGGKPHVKHKSIQQVWAPQLSDRSDDGMPFCCAVQGFFLDGSLDRGLKAPKFLVF